MLVTFFSKQNIYFTVAWTASLHKVVQQRVEYSYPIPSRAGKFRLLHRSGGDGVRLCWSQCGAGDSGNNSFNTREAFIEAHVEMCAWFQLHSCIVLLPHCSYELLVVREPSPAQHISLITETCMASCRSLHVLGYWKLSGSLFIAYVAIFYLFQPVLRLINF